MTRVFVDTEALANTTELELRGDDFHHLARVLRHRVGDELTLCDGAGLIAQARIRALHKSYAELELDAPAHRVERSPRPRVRALVATIKGDKMSFCVQKLSELGVDIIAPVVSERSVARPLGAKSERFTERLRTITRGAAAQCHRDFLTEVVPPKPLSDVWSAPPPGMRLRFGEEMPDRTLRDLDFSEAEELCFLIGPEGGFTDDERHQADQAGFIPVRLGPRILRAETAAVAAAAVLGFIAGDLASPASPR